jgi:Fe-S-cluster-containing dehydrogenase component
MLMVFSIHWRPRPPQACPPGLGRRARLATVAARQCKSWTAAAPPAEGLSRPSTGEGLLPRCVVACPTEARVFGDLDDPSSEVSVLLRERSYVVFPERGTQPSAHHLILAGPNGKGIFAQIE